MSEHRRAEACRNRSSGLHQESFIFARAFSTIAGKTGNLAFIRAGRAFSF